jgi:hypothetical protein
MILTVSALLAATIIKRLINHYKPLEPQAKVQCILLQFSALLQAISF